MIGSFFTRGLVMVFGYAYPAYECYKTIEKNKPQIEHLRFWCQYWILVAVLTVCERIADILISWLPFYNEAKLAFFIYLWYPKTQGTTHVYDSYFRPYISKYENDIDRLLLELRTRPGDMAILYWRWAASYGQTRVLEIFQHVPSHSTPSSRSTRLQRQGARTHQPVAAPNRQPSKISRQSAAAQPESEGPLSPTSSSCSSQSQMEVAEDVAPSQVREATPLATNEDTNSPTNEADMDEATLVTPAKLRKSLKEQFETSSAFSLQN